MDRQRRKPIGGSPQNSNAGAGEKRPAAAQKRRSVEAANGLAFAPGNNDDIGMDRQATADGHQDTIGSLGLSGRRA